MPDSILVTGGAGLVGTATVRHLTDQGRHVVALATQEFPDAQVDCFHDYAGLDRIVRVQT